MANTLNRIVKYSIYVLVFLLPLFFLPFSFEIFEYSKQYLLFFLVSLALLAWLAKQIFYDKEIKFKKSPIDYFVLGFLLISIISAIFSVDKNSSIFGFYGRFNNGLIELLGLGVLYFLITNNVEIKRETDGGKDAETKSLLTANDLVKLFLWSVGAVLFISYFSIFGIWAKIGSFLSLPQLMLQRTFNPVAGSLEGLAIFLSLASVLLLGLLLQPNAKRRTLFIHYLLLFLSLGLILIIGFTPAWIVLLSAMVLFVGVSLVKRIFKENVNKLLLPILLIILAAAVMVFQPIKTSLPKEQVLSQPISWQVAFGASTDNIKSGFLGSGPGTFQYDFAKYKPQSFNQTWMWQIRFDRAGSHLAELLGGQGFLGLISYLGLVGLVLIVSWFLMARHFIGLPFLMTFTALVAGQFVYYQNYSLAFLFWFVLGLLVVSWRAKSAVLVQEKIISFKNFPEMSLLFLTLAIIFGVAILTIYFYGIRYYLADVNYSKALSALGEARIVNLEKAVKLNPQFPQYRTILARAYLADALQEMQTGQDSAKIQLLVSRAIDQSKLATELQPNQVANWESLGVIYREIRGVAQGAVGWGIKSFEKAIELEPTNPALHTELGKLYLASGDKEKAKNSFNEALAEKPDYVTATIQLALLLEQENILDEAVAKLENLVINNPFDPEARFQLGRLYFNNSRIDEAIQQFSSVVILVPSHSNAHYSLGVAYASQGKKQLAIEEFEKVLELNPDNADVLQKLKDLKGK